MSSPSPSTSVATQRPRLCPPAWRLLALVAMGLLHRVAPLGRFLRAHWTSLGVVPIVVGTTIKPLQESSSLLTSGPFRVSRNPISLGMAGILFGTAIILGSCSPLLVPLAFVLLIEHCFIRKEEAMLERTFGQAHTDYRNRARRWL